MLNLQLTFILGYLFYGLVIVVHILIIQRIIPYELVNGGRSQSYEDQRKLSMISALIGLVGLGFIGYSQLFSEMITHWVYFVFVVFLTLFWLLGSVMQLLGTPFEKRVIIWVNLLGVIVHLSLALEFLLN
jgi:hypothetical protein